jgi:hypothetical protein
MNRFFLLVAAISISSSGCKTLTPDWSKNWLGFGSSTRLQESKYAVPARMAVLWSPAVLNQAGQTPTRGFGGRVYFYDSKNRPIAVEGQLVVYAYNNDKPNPESKVPDRKFAFTPEQFTTHYTPTELGASYSIWIPWDAVGQRQFEISLVPIFTSTSGALVMGQSSRNLLPGPSTPNTQSYVTNCTLPSALPGDGMPRSGEGPVRYDPAIQQASFQQPPFSGPQAVVPQQIETGGLSTMSITLPGTMADRLAQAPSQMSAMQKLALLRQEALSKQYGSYATPGISPTHHSPLTTHSTRVSAGGVPPPWFPASPQPAHSALPGPQAPASPVLPQAVGLPPTLPYHAAPLSGPPSLPGSAPTATAQESYSGAQRNR